MKSLRKRLKTGVSDRVGPEAKISGDPVREANVGNKSMVLCRRAGSTVVVPSFR